METTSNFEKWMITITVMLVAVVEVLDITIVNVSLPQMMGVFGATSEEITWVLTAYIVASAIFMPLTGVLIRHIGCRRLLLMNIIGFMIASMLCGAADNLFEIVFFRVLQGAFGASLVPISQYVLRNTFPREQQGKAMAIWGIGIMAGPVLGPTLGGYITEALNWRWIFYVNVPICILGFIMALNFIKETPRSDEKIDWVGVLWMAVGVGALQTFLDRGNVDNWFESNLISLLAIVCIASLTIFIYRGLNNKNNIINLHIFRERHFTMSVLILTIYGASLFGTVILQPLMLESLLHYPPNIAGEVMAPRGIASAITMIFVTRVISRHFDNRLIVFTGILITAFASYLMTQLDASGNMMTYIFPSIIQGIGMGFVFMPLSTCAFDYLSQKQIGEAAGLFSFGRSMGISIGTSILSTVLTRQTQVNWHALGAHVQATNPNFIHWAQAQNLDINSPLTLQLAANQVQAQAMMNGFLTAFWIGTAILVLLAPLVFLLKKGKDKTIAVVE